MKLHFALLLVLLTPTTFAQQDVVAVFSHDALASGSVLAWHNRNRSLLSEHGRFAQRIRMRADRGRGGR